MLKLRIPKNRIHYLIKQLAKCGDPDQAERGWALFHKGGVLDVRAGSVSRGSALTIEAIVKDAEELHETSLDLENFAESSCTCRQELPCVHMTAATFALYAPHGRTEMLLQELKALIVKTMQTRAKERPARQRNKPQEPVESGHPAAWQAYFERRFSGFAISHSYTFEMFAQAVWDTLPAYAAEWSPSRKRIFSLHIALFALRKIEDFYEQSMSSYLSAHHMESCKAAIAVCKERLIAAIDDSVSMLRPEDEPLWRETLLLIGEYALRGVPSPVDWLNVYRDAWWRLTKHPNWAEAEAVRIERLLASGSPVGKREALTVSAARIPAIRADGPAATHRGAFANVEDSPLSGRRATGHERDALLAAKAHFLVMDGRLEAAMRLLEEMHKLQVADVYFYLHRHSVREEWTALLGWLRWLMPMMRTSSAEEFRALCQYWTETAKHTDADREWVEAMENLLPRSYYVYTSYLLQTKRYRKWVDLQLSTRVSPLQLYALELRAVEKAEPQLLLPLYHQAAERAVLEKNRSSYITAIKMLGKLEELYRKLGKAADWERYVAEFGAKFSRLRAFQTELKKNRWIQ